MAFSFVRRATSRLAFRIYLFGLLQLVTVIAAVVALLIIGHQPPFPFPETVRFIASSIADTGGEHVAVSKVVSNLRSSLQASVAVYDADDRLVEHDSRIPAPPSRTDLPTVSPDLIAPVTMSSGKIWHLVFLVPPEPPALPIPTVALVGMVVVGISSWLLVSRTLIRPLNRLATAAHQFGAGKLDARVALNRSDELGQVANAFDEMADRVTRALRIEKELLANVSHELRTPLQRIHIAVELAAEGDAATARESLSEIAEDLSELERIVEDVLTATRLSLSDPGGGQSPASASPPMRPQRLDLRALLDKSTSRFRTAHPHRPLVVSIADDLPSLTGDGVLLRRVVDNLFDNAHKYSDDGTAEISLLAGWSDGRVLIEVRDRGPGIAPEDLKRVFEPFFRADRSRTRTTGGLGLGLALARRIVEAHRGTLTLESMVGVGTRCRIELPIT